MIVHAEPRDLPARVVEELRDLRSNVDGLRRIVKARDDEIATLRASGAAELLSRAAVAEGEVRRLRADLTGLLAERETWRDMAREELARDLDTVRRGRTSFLAAPGPVASLDDDRSKP